MTTKPFNLSILILFASCLAFLNAQECNNPLLETFNIPSLSAPESGADLPFCSNLQANQTCCSNATVTSFQERLNNLTTRLQDAASVRDRYITQLRDQFAQQYYSAVGNLSLLSGQINNIQTASATIGDEIIDQRDQIQAISTALVDLDSNFQADFQAYQNARVNCFTTVLKIQASAWCLACDPNYESQGVQTDGTIAYSPDLCSKITQACYPFLNAASKENPLYRAQQSLPRLQGLLAYIANFSTNGVIPNSVLQGDIVSLTNATQRTVTIPSGCADENNCPWQCQNLFSSQGVLNETIVENGAGVIGGADINFGSIGQSASGARRMLQGTPATWNPDIEATSMTVVVASDPANVAGTISGTRIIVVPVSATRFGVESAMVGMLVFIVSIMLLQ